MDNSEVLSNIAAENAALKIKIKQEYDKSCGEYFLRNIDFIL